MGERILIDELEMKMKTWVVAWETKAKTSLWILMGTKGLKMMIKRGYKDNIFLWIGSIRLLVETIKRKHMKRIDQGLGKSRKCVEEILFSFVSKRINSLNIHL